MSELAVKKNVTTIPATLNRFTAIPLHSIRKRRVAAYARVSTNEQEQLTSYTAQVDYYTKYIQERDARLARSGALRQYMETLRAENRVVQFNEHLWYGTVEQVRVTAEGRMRFVFKDGPVVEG